MRSSWLLQSNALEKSVRTAAKIFSLACLIFFNHIKKTVLRIVLFPKSTWLIRENSFKIVIHLIVEEPSISS